MLAVASAGHLGIPGCVEISTLDMRASRGGDVEATGKCAVGKVAAFAGHRGRRVPMLS